MKHPFDPLRASDSGLGADAAADAAREASARPGQRGPAAALRRQVLWSGGTPHRLLAGPVITRGYTLETVALRPDAVDRAAPQARALVIELPPGVGDALAWAGPSVNVALAHGLAVAFVMPAGPAAAGAVPPPADTAAREAFYAATAAAAQSHDGRVRGYFESWTDVVEWVLDGHDPGPGASTALRLEGEVPVDAAAQTLLRRAFHDLSGVTLEALPGGRSGAGVWIARPSAPDLTRHAMPFLVKWGELQKTRAEQSFGRLAHDSVSFRLRPPLHPTRCVEGATHGLLVFDFIERAIPFRVALEVYPAGQLIGSLFDHTLAGCLACTEERVAPPGPFFQTLKALRESDSLRAAAAAAGVPEIPDAAALIARVAALPPVPLRVATAHGDLHTGNLLVAAGSSDVLLIDFASIQHGMPVVADPACLEVSVAFGAPDEGADETETPDTAGACEACAARRATRRPARRAPSADADWLRRAYRFPLEPWAVPRRDDADAWLAEAVRAVRAAARQHESGPVPYAVAVASYLVRYASYADNGSVADRAVAYEIACALVVAAERAAEESLAQADAVAGVGP